jgi:hypothetical protein
MLASVTRFDSFQGIKRVSCVSAPQAHEKTPAGLPAATDLTKGQLAPEFPDLADTLGEHDVLCAWRRSPGGAVYVHVLPRNGE